MIRDTRFNVWVTEAKFSDDCWYPMPEWGCGNRRAVAKAMCEAYCIKYDIHWAMKDYVLTRRVRFRRYIPEVKPMKPTNGWAVMDRNGDWLAVYPTEGRAISESAENNKWEIGYKSELRPFTVCRVLVYIITTSSTTAGAT